MSKRDFVVLTTGRSGSTWVMDTLNRVEGLKAYGGLFYSKRRSGTTVLPSDVPRFIEYRETSAHSWRPRKVFAFLDELYGQPESIGFKLMYPQVRQFPEVMWYLLLRRIAVVHLIRRNHLDVLISKRRAEVSGRSHVREGEKDAGPRHFALDTRTLLADLERMSKLQAQVRTFLRMMRAPHLEVSYENLVAGDEEWKGLWEFLDVPPAEEKPTSALRKRGGLQREDVLSNIDEVRHILRGTRFNGLLSD